MGGLGSPSPCAKEQPVLAKAGQQRALPHHADCSRLCLRHRPLKKATTSKWSGMCLASMPFSVERPLPSRLTNP